MRKVRFVEEGHKYIRDDGKEYMSVSSLWKPYTAPFNAKEVSIKKAFKDYDNENYVTQKQIWGYDNPEFITNLFINTELPKETLEDYAQGFLKDWDDASKRGTAFHLKQENKDISNGVVINPFTSSSLKVYKPDVDEGYQNETFDISSIKNGYVPEFLATSDEYEVAGQLDRLFIETVGNTSYIDIDDWKTDKKIDKVSFFKRGSGYKMLKYPFDHIYDTNYWKYTMKISTYAYMLEMLGYTPRNLAFTHVVIDENLEILEQTRYDVPYKRLEAELCLKKKLSPNFVF